MRTDSRHTETLTPPLAIAVHTHTLQTVAILIIIITTVQSDLRDLQFGAEGPTHELAEPHSAAGSGSDGFLCVGVSHHCGGTMAHFGV